MGGSKGEKQEPVYKPRYTGMLEDVLTGGAMGMMMKQNPQAAGFLKPFQGQGMIGKVGNTGQGIKGTEDQSKKLGMGGKDPWKFGQ